MEFKVGDVIEITGPRGGIYDCLWSSRDEYLGMITTIKRFESNDGVSIVSLDGCGEVLFLTQWISHVCEEEDFDTDISDIIT